ncbi:ribosome maturation factor RimM [Falsarthrobacter nasiphocae]|uniref:Ribosome maturation factor RimM n=1 Tax=Falsarthrobacter nasiphocae TaxID=189863 RepID=A0AAE3YGM6_9MICC|nr:ribosome maturation factor RimM [Falsarthrobacter nasiphocae]MDR6892860.1 16S rRNA processing protein RimM [Falsarthrobacter nasiphocae]
MQVSVARIGKPHGIRGEVTVQVLTDAPDERFAPGSELGLEGIPGRSSVVVDSARWNKSILVLGFEGVMDRNAAETLRGGRLLVDPEAEGEAADEDEYYEHELRGLAVVENGAEIGRVEGLRTGAAQDLLVATINEREVLIPFVSQIVTEVDTAGGRVVVQLPAGLVDLADG